MRLINTIFSKAQTQPNNQAMTLGQANIIRKVFLHVTKSCNLRCSYCYASAQHPLQQELTTDEFNAIWPQIVALGPLELVFTGGEPLMRTDILQLLRGMQDADPDHKIVRCLNTNGHAVTPEIAHALVGLADEVRVSLDALSDRNDVLRGAGNFEAALRALDILYSAGFEPKVLVTLTSVAGPDLEELVCLLLKRGITRININEFRPVGRGTGHREFRADLREAEKAVQRARWRCGMGQCESIPQPARMRSSCGVGQFLTILSNGDVFPCHVLTQPEFHCGNIREQSLLEICNHTELLRSLQALDFQKMATLDPELRELANVGACMGTVYSAKRSSKEWQEHLVLPCKTSRF